MEVNRDAGLEPAETQRQNVSPGVQIHLVSPNPPRLTKTVIENRVFSYTWHGIDKDGRFEVFFFELMSEVKEMKSTMILGNFARQLVGPDRPGIRHPEHFLK